MFKPFSKQFKKVSTHIISNSLLDKYFSSMETAARMVIQIHQIFFSLGSRSELFLELISFEFRRISWKMSLVLLKLVAYRPATLLKRIFASIAFLKFFQRFINSCVSEKYLFLRSAIPQFHNFVKNISNNNYK